MVTADWTTTADNTWAFYLVPTTGMGGIRLFADQGASNLTPVSYGFADNGKRVVALGDLVTNGSDELFTTTDLTTADQALTSVRIEETTGGDVQGYVILP